MTSRRGVIAGGLAAGALAATAKGAAPKRPNILLILADDLGFSDIAPFGSEIPTPNLDALARQGRVMTSFYATPMPFSRAEVMTGADHHKVGWGGMYIPWGKQAGSLGYQRQLNAEALAVAEPLRDAGYHTYMIGTWHLGEGDDRSPKAQGFESSHALLPAAGLYYALGPGERPPTGAHEPPVYREDGRLIPAPPGYITDLWTDRMIGWLERDAKDGRPFFAYAAYTTPHFPLQAPDDAIARQKGRYDGGYDAVRLARLARQRQLRLFPRSFKPAEPVPAAGALAPGMERWADLSPERRRREARRMEVYAAMVENLDWNIGRLFDSLKKSGRYDDTFIVFTSGNGGAQGYPEATEDNRIENMGRKGSWIYYTERWAEVSNAPFALWKTKPAEGGISVPAIFRLPGQTRRAANSDAPATVRDLAPTFLELAGIPQPGASYKGRKIVPMSGRSMVAHLKGRTATVHPADHVFAEESSGEAYVRQGRWKAVLITAQHSNPFERGDPLNADHIAALRAGDMQKAAAIRAKWVATWRLYDIVADRGETTDLAAARPEVLKRLQALYADYRRDAPVIDPI